MVLDDILHDTPTPRQLARLRRRVRLVLADNDWLGEAPRSLRQYGRLTGIGHPILSSVLRGTRRSRRALRLLVMLAGGQAERAIAEARARQRRMRMEHR